MDTVPSSTLTYLQSETEPVAQQLWSLFPALVQEGRDLTRSHMVYAINEISKTVLNWIGKGHDGQLNIFAHELDRFLSADAELDDPLAGVTQKRKFGANLAFLLELINVYRHSDLELKDYHLLLLEDKVANRLRKVLMVFFHQDRRLNTADIYRIVYGSAHGSTEMVSEPDRKRIQRDLEKLMENGLIQRIPLSPKKFVYEATPRAFAYKNDILQRELGMNEFLLTQAPLFGAVPNEAGHGTTVASHALIYRHTNT